ncbi:MAG: S9 family peptidase [Saprospiraceae bacterium]|nr:S9 family peptidase [Saprospiraceae bacterium]
MKKENDMTSSTPLPGDTRLPSSEETLRGLMELGTAGDYPYAVEDFFRLPEKTGFDISPDGKYIAYVGPYQRRQNLFVIPTANLQQEPVQITFETDRDISGFLWANGHRLIYLKDSAGDENYQLFAVNVDGREAKALTPFPNVRTQLVDDLEDDDRSVLIALNKNNPQLFDPYRIDVYTGELQQLATNNNPAEPIDSWITDHDGKLRMAMKVKDGINACLMYRDHEGEPFREIITTDFRESIMPLAFDFDQPHIVYVSSNHGRDKSVVIAMDMHTRKEVGDPIYSHREVDVSSLAFSKKRRKLTAVTYITDKKHYHFLDEERRNLQQKLEKRLPGKEISLTSTNRNEDIYLVRAYSDRSLGAYHLYVAQEDRLEKICAISPWIREEDMVSMEPVEYRSRDGLTIHGYLTLPKSGNKNLPVVINPHGGPWVRDVWGYNPEVQLLANRGMAVLQINYRGSTGYGKKFWTAGFKEWGHKMQDDLTDGVKWLIEQGIADPDRVAIYGGSYGGYATLAGVTFTPELYACAIDYVGVANLFTFMKTIPPYWMPYLQMMYEMVGDPEKDQDRMHAGSPVYHVDQIQAPLLVIQGANDPRVNIDESDQIVKSLRSRNIDVPYMVKYDEGHGFRNEENRFEVYKVMLGFLKEHLLEH